MIKVGTHQENAAGRWHVIVADIVGWTEEDDDGWIYPITAPERVWRSRLSWNMAQKLLKAAKAEIGEFAYIDDKYPHEREKVA